MADFFALLGQPRRPWIDLDSLRESFHRASAEHHPDARGGSDNGLFAELNAAHAALREPASRLRHLLALEFPAQLENATQIPAALGDLFLRIAEARTGCEAFVAKDSAATSPLVRALLAPEKIALRRRLESAEAELELSFKTALDELRALDADWDARPPHTAAKLAALQQRFAFFSKWDAQIREDIFKLAT